MYRLLQSSFNKYLSLGEILLLQSVGQDHKQALPQCNRLLKADSYIACHAHAVPLPCRAGKGFRICLSHLIYTVRPCLIHTCHAMPFPRPCPALTMPFFSRPRYSTAVDRRPVGYLLAFGFFRLPRGVPRRLLSEAYQSSSQRSILMTIKSGSSTLQKKTIC